MLNQIDIVIALVRELNPWICLLLFLVYGVAFEMLSVKFLALFRDFRAYSAANITVILFILNLWGLGSALNDNIMYALPIALGSWVGTVVQVKLEKRKSEKESEAGY